MSDAPLPEPEPGSIRADFNQYLQRPAADGPFKDLDVHAQVAADAFAVRHHAAEVISRLACARLAPSTGAAVPCLCAKKSRRARHNHRGHPAPECKYPADGSGRADALRAG
ncbi:MULTISPECIES: hypothetical protein [Nocardioides]|uniref:Uncharacterized protein n=1 Tax=Nocardioides vastitatis TaxID=2568655 RepID=A0ABW0ZIS0_9ACTN|nr:hypothetical protein [Nocardioides sp.]THJ06265.1 hypothetical protein E7Z54_06540 [Nocardioides sp.]